MANIARLIKVDEDSDTLTFTNGIQLPADGFFEIRNHRGFIVAKIDSSGNLYHKGEVRKIQ